MTDYRLFSHPHFMIGIGIAFVMAAVVVIALSW
jgi:hypothetical protein